MSKGMACVQKKDGRGGNSRREVVADARSLDQFYTAPHIAKHCMERLNEWIVKEGICPELWIEPSAGAGAFFHCLPRPRIGIDLDPRADGIVARDFLSWKPEEQSGTIVTVGNPPFGKNASLAIRFFNHAATFAEIIAFIAPRTFEKASIQNRLDKAFHLESEMAIPPDSFLFEGRSRDVPCVFQIWRKRAVSRPSQAIRAKHPDFAFTDATGADIAFQRIGHNAGRVKDARIGRSPSSHYFIRDLTPDKRVSGILKSIDWTEIKHRTAGCPSIGKSEMVQAYATAIRLPSSIDYSTKLL